MMTKAKTAKLKLNEDNVIDFDTALSNLLTRYDFDDTDTREALAAAMAFKAGNVLRDPTRGKSNLTRNGDVTISMQEFETSTRSRSRSKRRKKWNCWSV